MPQAESRFSAFLNSFKDVLVFGDEQNDPHIFAQKLQEYAAIKNICVVAFLPDTEDDFLCLNMDCQMCPGRAEVVALAHRMCGVTSRPIFGDEVFPLLGEDSSWFHFKMPLFVPLFVAGEPAGAVWCDCSAELTDEQQQQIVVASLALCISFRNKLFNKYLVGHEGTLTRILENMDANLYVTAKDDSILFINKKMRDEFEITENVIGQKCWEVLQEGMPGRCPFCPCNILEVNADEPIVWEEHNTVTGKYYKNTDTLIEWIDGTQVHMQHSVDITAEKAIQQSLIEAKQAADFANKAKSDFLSRMSHEIRTPLNAIIGMARIGMNTADFDKMQECIRKIDNSSNHLLGLINDILDMSKIEASKMELAHESFDFEKMLIDISNIITVKSEEKAQKLHIHMDTNMPRFYIGDELRVTQVITNLLSNAVKFTPNCGTVRMDVREKEHFADASIIEVRVSDTGIGISQAQQAALFTAFEQADGGIARRFGGTGLGLAISKSIVRLMNGDIRVESELGHGSTFIFEIRLVRNKTMVSPHKQYKDVDYSSLRTLLCDESAETREYFLQIMDSLHIGAEAVATTQECLDKLEYARINGSSYQLVFMDWDANAVDRSFFHELKQKYGSCIIVLISAAQWSELQPEEDSPISQYIAKPIFPSTLFNVINTAIGVPGKSKNVPQSTRYFFAGYRILLVEDIEVNRDVLCMSIEDTKVKITIAENGKIATELFEANPGAYDLILMDVNMPFMDGYEATRYIRSLPIPQAKKIPILAMTANAFAEDIEKSLACGMNDHLTKPISIDLLCAKLQQYLIDEKAPTNIHNEVVEMSDLQSSATQEVPGIDEFINVADALGRVRGNVKIYKTLLQSFLKNSRVPELSEEIHAGDFDAAAKTAHSIKGASANLSLIKLTGIAANLEERLKTGSYDPDMLVQCMACFEKTKEFIDVLLNQL